MKLRFPAVVLGLTALAVGPLPAALLPMNSVDVAHAESSKGNGNGNSASHSAESHGNSANAHAANSNSSGHSTSGDDASLDTGNGSLHSELKGLNAVKANPNALEHAAPNSQVGRIAAYRDAARVTIGAHEALDEAEATLAGLDVPARDIDAIDADIAALDPNASDYNDALAALEAERANAEAYADAVTAVDVATAQLETAGETEQAALLAASGGRMLSAEAIAYVRAALNL